jgi:hypothetical protein
MDPEDDDGQVSYVIPERTIAGSVPQILEEIDDMIDALRIVREAVVRHTPKPARGAYGHRWRARIGQALRFTGLRELSAKR